MGATLPRISYKRETPIPTTVGVSHSLAAPHLPAGAAFLWVSGGLLRLAAGREGLDDDHARATARAWPGQQLRRVRGNIGLLLGIGGRRGDIEECAGRCDVLGAVG